MKGYFITNNVVTRQNKLKAICGYHNLCSECLLKDACTQVPLVTYVVQEHGNHRLL